jgi:excisionase family DNA binding protein
VKKLMSRKEAADYLGLSERTVYARYQAGDLPAVRVGRVLRFDRRALDRWRCAVAVNTPTLEPEALKAPPVSEAEFQNGELAERLLGAMRAEQRETNRLLARLLSRRS